MNDEIILDIVVGCNHAIKQIHYCIQAHREGEEGTGDTFPGPPNFKGPHVAFIFMIITFKSCIFTLFLYLLLSIALSGLNDLVT